MGLATFLLGSQYTTGTSESDRNKLRNADKWIALAGAVYCFIAFFTFLYRCAYGEPTELPCKPYLKRLSDIRRKVIQQGTANLRAAFYNPSNEESTKGETHNDDDDDVQLLDINQKHRNEELSAFLREFFVKYDHDNSGSLSLKEMACLMVDLNEPRENLRDMMDLIDLDSNGEINYEEFCNFMSLYVTTHGKIFVKDDEGAITTKYEQEEEDEEGEIPSSCIHADPKTQLSRITRYSLLHLLLGTCIVLLFSEPTCGVLEDFGNRISINPFYISFILSPLASNGSEIYSAYTYAAKKTRKSVAISTSVLLSASIMNNTFCLGIFFLIIYIKKLTWSFSAETSGILFVEAVMVLYSFKRIHKMVDGLAILLLLPISLALIIALKGMGWN